ncbi:MAG: hypothetical protein NPIRA02_29340 [Nitrospirales bacterium]|nr:MAG: hypothetical protein NPIRA02_29340 [Nitrospirales bacterium]
MKKPFVLVTTDSKNRGVFAGILDSGSIESERVVLKQAHMCVMWSTDERGVFGLASHGPSDKCRITRPVPKTSINYVTSITVCTSQAEKRWRACPWRK